MNTQKNHVMLLFGGGKGEHEISRLSAEYITQSLKDLNRPYVIVELKSLNKWYIDKDQVTLQHKGLETPQGFIPISYCIPCIHGFPGETGDIQPVLDFCGIDYLGANREASTICFNKISTKLWLSKATIPVVDFIFLASSSVPDKNHSSFNKIHQFFEKYLNEGCFIKASSEGSSRGVYFVKNYQDALSALNEAKAFSSHILIEPKIKGRELEMSVFDHQGKWSCSSPGEILCPDGFYDYHQKYSKQSQTVIKVEAEDVEESVVSQMQELALQCQKVINIHDLFRVDFFLTENNQIYINEINSFPGMTDISLFPKMMEKSGVLFKDFLNSKIKI